MVSREHRSLRILVVEDDRKFAAQLQTYLRQHFFEVDVQHDGSAAVEQILLEQPHLVILDLMLPGSDGIGVCRALAGAYRGRILMLTASHSEADHVAGLEVGADDFITKPVVPRILLAHVRALLRRESLDEPHSVDAIAVGPLVVDSMTREARFLDQPVPLTGAEFDVLHVLASRAGTVVTRDALYRARGMEYDGIDRGLDIHVARLRRKLADVGATTELIKAVRGEGYILAVRP